MDIVRQPAVAAGPGAVRRLALIGRNQPLTANSASITVGAVPEPRAIALVGDDVEDRDGHPLDAARLSALGGILDAAYPTGRRAGFDASASGLVGLLAPDADPILAVLRVGLLDGAPRVRWAITATAGSIGGATDGPAPEALDALSLARARRDRLIVRTGEPGADRLLDAIAPLLLELLDELTDRQRPVARMLLLEGLRQADVADALGVSRATVSVMAGRGRVRSIERLAGAVRAVTAAGLQARLDADRRSARAGSAGRPRAAKAPGSRT